MRPRFGQLFKSSARWNRKGRTNQIVFSTSGSSSSQGGGGFVVAAATRAASSALLTLFRIVCYGLCCWFDDKSNPVCMCYVYDGTVRLWALN